jgi:uncharacterized protein (TIGR02996 family)
MEKAALLAAIAACPADDQPRQVYADWLLERGDPRGELIQLQLLASPTEAHRTRVERLLAAHRHTWQAELGELATLGEVTFARGFPAVLTLRDVYLPSTASMILERLLVPIRVTLIAWYPRALRAVAQLRRIEGLCVVFGEDDYEHGGERLKLDTVLDELAASPLSEFEVTDENWQWPQPLRIRRDSAGQFSVFRADRHSLPFLRRDLGGLRFTRLEVDCSWNEPGDLEDLWRLIGISSARPQPIRFEEVELSDENCILSFTRGNRPYDPSDLQRSPLTVLRAVMDGPVRDLLWQVLDTLPTGAITSFSLENADGDERHELLQRFSSLSRVGR